MRIEAPIPPKGDLAVVLSCLGLGAVVSLGFAWPGASSVLVKVAASALFLALVWDIRLVVPILVFALPFGPRFQMGFGSLYLTTAILMITYVAWLVRAPMGRRLFSFRVDSIGLGMTAFVVVLLLSALQNIGFLLSHQVNLMRFVQFFLYLGIFPLVMHMRFTRPQMKTLLALILAAGVFEAFLGVLQWQDRPGYFMSGTFDGMHNHFSAHVVFICILLVGVLLRTRKAWVALLSAGGIGLTVYANVFSFSRTGYVSMIVSIFAFLLMPVGSVRKVLIVGVTAVAAGVALLVTPVDVVYRAWDIYWTVTGRRVAGSFSERLTLWGEAYRDFRANPLLGRGAWAYNLRDNFYIKLIAESGLLGLAAFIGLLYVILRAEWQALVRYDKDDFVSGLAIGLFPASIGGLLIFNLAGDFFQVHRFIGIFWLVLALVLKSVSGEGSVPNEGEEETAYCAVR